MPLLIDPEPDNPNVLIKYLIPLQKLNDLSNLHSSTEFIVLFTDFLIEIDRFVPPFNLSKISYFSKISISFVEWFINRQHLLGISLADLLRFCLVSFTDHSDHSIAIRHIWNQRGRSRETLDRDFFQRFLQRATLLTDIKTIEPLKIIFEIDQSDELHLDWIFINVLLIHWESSIKRKLLSLFEFVWDHREFFGISNRLFELHINGFLTSYVNHQFAKKDEFFDLEILESILSYRHRGIDIELEPLIEKLSQILTDNTESLMWMYEKYRKGELDITEETLQVRIFDKFKLYDSSEMQSFDEWYSILGFRNRRDDTLMFDLSKPFREGKRMSLFEHIFWISLEAYSISLFRALLEFAKDHSIKSTLHPNFFLKQLKTKSFDQQIPFIWNFIKYSGHSEEFKSNVRRVIIESYWPKVEEDSELEDFYIREGLNSL